MQQTGLSFSKLCGLAIMMVNLILASSALASGPTETALYTFLGGNSDGCNPVSTVVFDAAGNMYGTTTYCGAFGAGAVFELSPPAGLGGSWTETILYSFGGSGSLGSFPSSGVILEPKGPFTANSLMTVLVLPVAQPTSSLRQQQKVAPGQRQRSGSSAGWAIPALTARAQEADWFSIERAISTALREAAAIHKQAAAAWSSYLRHHRVVTQPGRKRYFTTSSATTLVKVMVLRRWLA
jgi:hypothetical protein